jgi:hypothetical protein
MSWSGDGRGCGVMVGGTTQLTTNTPYSGDMYIDSSMTFNINSNREESFGVSFYSTLASSTQTINGTFTISSNNIASGVYFSDSAAGNIVINGVFLVHCYSDVNPAYGICFNGGTITAKHITINGTFTVLANNSARGVYFYNFTSNSAVLDINGVFTISSGDDAQGVFFDRDISNITINIGGIFAIDCLSPAATATAIMFSGTQNSISVKITNATFAIQANIASSV